MNESLEKPRRPTLLLVLAFAAVYLIWGSTYLAIRIAVQSIAPLLLGGVRFSIAGAALYLTLRALGIRAPSLREWVHASVSGVLMASIGNGLVSVAEEHVPSNIAALLLACVPLHVALLDWLRPGGKRPTFAAFAGIALGLVGVLLLVAPAAGEAQVTDTLGVLSLLGAGLSWAAGILYTRQCPRHPNALMASGQQMFAGGAVLLVCTVAHGDVDPGVLSRVSGAGIVAFVYLTLCGSIIAFSAFTWLVDKTSTSKISTIAYVNPMVAVIVGWFVLDETLNARALWGALLVVAAVALMSIDIKTLRARLARSRTALPRRA